MLSISRESVDDGDFSLIPPYNLSACRMRVIGYPVLLIMEIFEMPKFAQLLLSDSLGMIGVIICLYRGVSRTL